MYLCWKVLRSTAQTLKPDHMGLNVKILSLYFRIGAGWIFASKKL